MVQPAGPLAARRTPHALLQYFALLVVTLLVGAQPARADGAAAVEQVTLNDVTAGELLFGTAAAGRYLPAVQLESRADITVSGIVATVDVVQRFRNAGREWAAGIYVFPLPETAGVNALELRVGERVIVGEIREKRQARREYQQAKTNGQKAALVEQRRPNMFATAVANVAPGQEVEVHLTYVETVSYDDGRFSLRFPMTITPRYIAGQPRPALEGPLSIAPGAGWAINTAPVPDAAEITPYLDPRPPRAAAPGNAIELHVTVDPGLPLAEITSAYHDIQIVRQAGSYDVRLVAGSVPMDRDFQLSWRPAVASTPTAALFTQEHDGETYALAMILPPESPTRATRLSRETVFIIDTSGSMGGEPIRQARAALDLALYRLDPRDRFNVIAFNDTATSMFSTSTPADAASIASARQFVARLQSGGGTEMSAALTAAFAGATEDSAGQLRQVIFITDGAVGNEDALFRQIADNLGDRRLFTVGIGSAPNSYFMRKAAQFGRGTFTYIGRQSEVEARMEELFARLEKPLLRDIVMTWTNPDVVATPDPVPDLYAGQPIVVTARLGQPAGALQITGETADGPWEQTLRLTRGREYAGVSTLWARDRIAALDDQIALRGETKTRRQRLLRIALAHKLVSRYTSFIAVDRTPSRPTGLGSSAENLPNLRPHGQTPQTYAYPQTATTATEAFWLGLLGLIATALLWIRVFNVRASAESTAAQDAQR